MFVAAGCRDVETYIQSGNVVFTVSAARAKGIAPRVGGELKALFGHDIPLVIRSAVELRSIAGKNPFVAKGVDPDWLHVAFLADKPGPARVAALDPAHSKPDAFIVKGSEVYLHCPNGMGKSKLTNAYFDRILETTSTVRNWRTVLALCERASV
jgi:uncharacterized protein (DUF1697 family)